MDARGGSSREGAGGGSSKFQEETLRGEEIIGDNRRGEEPRPSVQLPMPNLKRTKVERHGMLSCMTDPKDQPWAS
jgi:hypothetical protein